MRCIFHNEIRQLSFLRLFSHNVILNSHNEIPGFSFLRIDPHFWDTFLFFDCHSQNVNSIGYGPFYMFFFSVVVKRIVQVTEFQLDASNVTTALDFTGLVPVHVHPGYSMPLESSSHKWLIKSNKYTKVKLHLTLLKQTSKKIHFKQYCYYSST